QMLKVSKRKAHTRKASQVSADTQKAAQCNKQIYDISQMLTQMDNNKLQLIYQNIVQLTNNEKTNQMTLRQKLVNMIEQLPNNQLKLAAYLFNKMRYDKETNENKLLLSFLQDKALNFIKTSFYKPHQDSGSLVKQLVGTLSHYKCKKSRHISKVHATAHKSQLADSQSLNATIQAIIMKDKHHYTIQFINMAAQVSQISQISFRSMVQATQLILGFLTEESLSLPISSRSIIRWNQEISEIHIDQILNKNNFSIFFTLGIMVNESTR
ncbi:31702_t:CDS:2, partial [Racocetra persica]